MWLLNFLFKRKRKGDAFVQNKSVQQKTTEKGKRSQTVAISKHPADIFLGLTAKHYHLKEFDKALENANKAIELGIYPNDTMLSVIKSKIEDRNHIEQVSFSEKVQIIKAAIDSKVYIEFLYPGNDSYFETIFRATPLKLDGDFLRITNSDILYDLNKIKKLRTFKPNYIAEKPN